MRTLPFLLLLLIALAIAGFIGILTYFSFNPGQNFPKEDLGGQAPQTATTPTRPVISSTDPVRGDPSARIAIVEFGDFFCPACAEIETTLQKILTEYEGKVKLVWKDLPNTQIHPLAQKAAEAARCASQQGAFWQYHDLLFINQASLTAGSFTQIARELGLNGEAFSQCITSESAVDLVTRTFNEAIILRVDATPYFFIGERRISGAPDEAQLKEAIENAYGTPTR